MATRHPETVSLRYLAAPVAVIGVILGISLGVVGLLVGLPWLAVLGFAAPAGYLVLDLIASAVAALTRPHLTPGAALRLPLVYAAMHATWGWGFLRGGVRSS